MCSARYLSHLAYILPSKSGESRSSPSLNLEKRPRPGAQAPGFGRFFVPKKFICNYQGFLSLTRRCWFAAMQSQAFMLVNQHKQAA